MDQGLPFDLDLQTFTPVFVVDTEESLAAMEENLLALERNHHDAEAIGAIFRAAHTIKGNANLIGFRELGDFAHAVETVLDQLRSGQRAPDSELISCLLHTVDTLRAFTVRLASDATALFHVDPTLRARIDALAMNDAASAQTTTGAPDRAESPALAAMPESGSRTLRVPVERLDQILNLTSEITISRGRERSLLQSNRAVEADEVHQEADRLYAQLREEVAKLRLVPIAPVFRRLRRMIRDLTQTCGKQVNVEFEGEDVELDTSIIDQLNDPLMHMVRNSVDHGIETPEERTAAGKLASGVIRISATYETGNVVIRLHDDGRGLSRERILARALERGLPVNPETASDLDIYSLIFEPGFSTADVVTDLSGRGVGLDVVKRSIEVLRGSVTIQSAPGVGTSFSLRLPLTVATIEGFGVDAGGETFILPLDYVVECVELPSSARDQTSNGAGIMNLRGAPIPFVRLAELFSTGAPPGARESAVIVQSGEVRMGIVVERLRGEGEAVIKPLGRMLGNIPGVSGSTILGSGRIGLIIDVPALVQRACASAGVNHVGK